MKLFQNSPGRHETFTPRYGWLKKGYEAVKQDEDAFKAPNAIERLGVGKNMVRSIKHWCLAFKIIENFGRSKCRSTPFGDALLSDNGWDPYLEDIASLWLLHWQLFIPPFYAVGWPLFFDECKMDNFDLEAVGELMWMLARKQPDLAGYSQKSFKKDASCLIRMYYADPNNCTDIDCPFTQLELIQKDSGSGEYVFDTSGKGVMSGLSVLIIAAACFSFLANYASPKQRSISFMRLTHDKYSPGKACKIVAQRKISDALEEAAGMISGFKVAELAGEPQLYFEKDPQVLYWDALQCYYKDDRVINFGPQQQKLF